MTRRETLAAAGAAPAGALGWKEGRSLDQIRRAIDARYNV